MESLWPYKVMHLSEAYRIHATMQTSLSITRQVFPSSKGCSDVQTHTGVGGEGVLRPQPHCNLITTWLDGPTSLAERRRECGHSASTHTNDNGMGFAIRRSGGIVLRCHYYAPFIVLVNIPCRKKARVYVRWFDKRTANNYGGKPEKSSYTL